MLGLGTGLVVWVGLRVNSVIINIITEINYRCNNMQIFLKYKNNVKACMYTISALYHMINLNVRTQYMSGLCLVFPLLSCPLSSVN